MTHIVLGDKVHLSYLFFPRCVSWFMPARGNSPPKHTISQYIFLFRHHPSKSLNYCFALPFYHKSTLCFLFNIKAAWITQDHSILFWSLAIYIYTYSQGGLSGNRHHVPKKPTSLLGLLSLLTNCSCPI